MREINFKKWLVFISTSLFLMIVNFDMTTINLALVNIAWDFQASVQDLSWVLNGYFITTAISFVIAGRLADCLGERFVFRVGCLSMIVGALIAGFSYGVWSLVLGRFLQGIGSGFGFSVAMLIITQQFPESEKGKAVSCAVTLGGLAQGVGPAIAGKIIQFWDWRGIFFVGAGVVILSLAMTWSWLPVKKTVSPRERFDWVGAIFFAGGVLSFLIALNRLEWWSVHRLYWPALAGMGFVLLILLVRHVREVKFPLISPALRANKSFLSVIFVRVIAMSIWSAFLFLLPHYLQNIRDMSVASSANMLLLITLTFGVLSPLNGLWMDRVGSKYSAQIAMCLAAIAFILLACVELWQLEPLLYIGLFLFGVHSALIVSGSIHAALKSLPEAVSGSGMGLFYTISFSGATLGVVLSGAVISSVSDQQLWTHLPELMKQLSESQIMEIKHSLMQTHASLSFLTPSEWAAVWSVLHESLAQGFVRMMALCAGLSFLGFLLTQGFPESQEYLG